MFAKSSLTRPLLILILATVLIVTTIVAFTVINLENRNVKFFLSLTAILFSQFMIFGYPIYLSSATGITKSPRLPLGIGMYSILLVYGIATLILALLAITPIAFTWLALLHLILFGIILIFLAIWKISSGELDAMSADENRNSI